MSKFTRRFVYFSFLIIFFFGGWYLSDFFTTDKYDDIEIAKTLRRPLDKYSIDNLSKTKIEPGNIEIKNNNLFKFTFSPDLGKSTKTTTGQIRVPSGEGEFPIIVMLRGYVDQEIYKTGMGTSSAAKVFSENGFITIAPDFLGYAGSDPEDPDIFEARFQTYVTAVSLLKSLDQIEKWDGESIFIWGHSNGGQVALTVLEITGKDIPTTLWAPVTKPFPYSVLYYTDESEDRGKFLRSQIAKFEKIYNPDLYSLDLYLDKIKAPLQIHQGTADDAVPVDWTNLFTKRLKELEKDFDYYKYPGADHNMKPSWDTAVARGLSFFQSYLK